MTEILQELKRLVTVKYLKEYWPTLNQAIRELEMAGDVTVAESKAVKAMDNLILDDAEIKAIKSMGLYWREVEKRDHPIGVLLRELTEVVGNLGIKTLWVLLAYAEYQHTRKGLGK